MGFTHKQLVMSDKGHIVEKNDYGNTEFKKKPTKC